MQNNISINVENETVVPFSIWMERRTYPIDFNSISPEPYHMDRVFKFVTELNLLLTKQYMNTNVNLLKQLSDIEKIYDTIYNDFLEVVYKNMKVKPIQFICTLYINALSNISEIIKYTYNNEVLSSDKEIIIKVIHKIYKIFTKTSKAMIELEKKSDYVKNILKVAEENEGKLIEDKESIESQIYYCYRHMNHSFIEENALDFLTYEDGKYTYEEIYDYYYGENVNFYHNDDTFISEFEKWFKSERNTSHYSSSAPLSPLYTYHELKARIKFHTEELETYTNLMDNMYP
jgi:hypothetical protein